MVVGWIAADPSLILPLWFLALLLFMAATPRRASGVAMTQKGGKRTQGALKGANRGSNQTTRPIIDSGISCKDWILMASGKRQGICSMQHAQGAAG